MAIEENTHGSGSQSTDLAASAARALRSPSRPPDIEVVGLTTSDRQTNPSVRFDTTWPLPPHRDVEGDPSARATANQKVSAERDPQNSVEGWGVDIGAGVQPALFNRQGQGLRASDRRRNACWSRAADVRMHHSSTASTQQHPDQEPLVVSQRLLTTHCLAPVAKVLNDTSASRPAFTDHIPPIHRDSPTLITGTRPTTRAPRAMSISRL